MNYYHNYNDCILNILPVLQKQLEIINNYLILVSMIDDTQLLIEIIIT